MTGRVQAVHRSAEHAFSKNAVESIELLAHRGVRDDAHCGQTVQHRSRVARDPTQPNLRQVHLLHAELLDDLDAEGFMVAPGYLGENITTRGVDLLALSAGSQIRVGATAVIRVTGLRNPCGQIEAFQSGLLRALLQRLPDGGVVRRAGIMAVVEQGGFVRPGDALEVSQPEIHVPMQVV
jgi:MOSC domain-containing protein YiiM